jgi:hypothetical protein
MSPEAPLDPVKFGSVVKMAAVAAAAVVAADVIP